MTENTQVQPEKTVSATDTQSAGGSAPEKTTAGQPAAKVEAAEKRSDGQNKAKDFFAKRQERKASLEERIEQLTQTVESLAGSTRQKGKAKEERTSIFDSGDPDAMLDEKFSSPSKQIEELNQHRQRQEAEREVALKHQAEEYILSRSHLQDPYFGEAIKNRLQNDPVLVTMSKLDPMRAAKAAYLDVCEEKGVSPDLRSSYPGLAGRASGARATAAQEPQGKRTQAEWQAYVKEAKAGSKERDQRIEEMKKALREG